MNTRDDGKARRLASAKVFLVRSILWASAIVLASGWFTLLYLVGQFLPDWMNHDPAGRAPSASMFLGALVTIPVGLAGWIFLLAATPPLLAWLKLPPDALQVHRRRHKDYPLVGRRSDLTNGPFD
jgi:hypothetical protein